MPWNKLIYTSDKQHAQFHCSIPALENGNENLMLAQ